MADDHVTEYLRARAELQRSTERVEKFVGRIKDISKALSEWRRVMVGNIGGEGYPMEIALGQHISIDANSWPQVEQLHQLLVEWHKAKRRAESTWDRISPDLRQGLQAPPN